MRDVGKIPLVVGKRLYERQVKVLTNHYKVKIHAPRQKIYLYKIKMSPEISLDNRQLLRQILDQVKEQITECLGQFY